MEKSQLGFELRPVVFSERFADCLTNLSVVVRDFDDNDKIFHCY